VESLVALSDGDARCALNGLEFMVNAKLAAAAADGTNSEPVIIGDKDVRSELIRSHIVYDRLGTCSLIYRDIVTSGQRIMTKGHIAPAQLSHLQLTSPF